MLMPSYLASHLLYPSSPAAQVPPLIPSPTSCVPHYPLHRYLGIDCSVLMGANIAEGIAREEFSEAVIGER